MSDRPERISAEEVDAVARLAMLALTEDQVERFAHQLADVLDHAADIEALDLDGVEPMARPVRVVNVLRPDEPGPALDRDEVLGQAPAAEDGQFRVPPVLGGAP